MEERSNPGSTPPTGAAGELARTYARQVLGAWCREIRGPLHLIVGSLELLETTSPRQRAALMADIRQRTDDLLGVMGRALLVADRGGRPGAGSAATFDSPRNAEREPRHRFVSLWRHLLSRRREANIGEPT